MTRRILLHMCIALDKSTPNGSNSRKASGSQRDRRWAFFQIS